MILGVGSFLVAVPLPTQLENRSYAIGRTPPLQRIFVAGPGEAGLGPLVGNIATITMVKLTEWPQGKTTN